MKPLRLSKHKYKLLMEEVLLRDRYTCQGKDCPGGWFLDPPHHIIFRSQGGSDVEENLITLCRYCHGAKHGVNYVR